ncbi:MAG: T9SS type A sorting domain-containing protein [candidate division Zixibacteria bacterium]|nr:T9SS type A sorting domain-containing protein [candidate division Zixibacteria bacterium]
MRLSRTFIPALTLLLTLQFASQANAQLFICEEGIDYNTYTPDTLRVVSFKGLANDTVELPIYFAADSIVLGMTINVRYPSTLIRPVVFPDTLIDTTINTAVLPPDTTIDTIVTEFLSIRETGRAFFPIILKDAEGFDSITVPKDLFQSNSLKVRDSSLLKVQWLAKFAPPLDSIPGGSGEIVRIKFVVLPTATEGASEVVRLEHRPVLDASIFPPIQIGCALSASAQNWTTFFFNEDGTIDTQILPLLQVPILGTGFFRVAEPDLPQCVTFTDCVSPPAGFALPAFCVEGNCEYTVVGPGPQGCQTNNDCNSPPAGFTLPGFCDANGNCQYTRIVLGNAPVLEQQASPKLLTQGETVSFTVTATDPDPTDVITISGNFPPGATFQSTPSITPAIGAFSWTPDLTQAGTFVASFIATDDQGLSSAQMNVTIIVEELKFDQLFSTSADNESAAGGIPGFNPVIFPIDLTSRQDSVYGVQFDMEFPFRQISLDSIITTARTPFYTVDWVALTDSTVRVLTLGLNNEPLLPGLASDILRVIFSVDSVAIPGEYPINLFNGRESIDPDPSVGSAELLSLPGIVEVDNLGDVNLDRVIDVADMVNVIGFIIGNFTFPLRQSAAADVTRDGAVDVIDLVGINNLIFDLPIITGPGPGGAPIATLDLDASDIKVGEFSSVSVIGDFPEEVAGVEFHIDYNPATISLLEPELTYVSRNFNMRFRSPKRGELRVVLYKTASMRVDELIPRGISDILSLPMVTSSGAVPSDISVSNIALSNQFAGKIETERVNEALVPESFTLHQNYPNPFNPSTTIKFTIRGEGLQDVALDVFNILGQKVITLVDDQRSPADYTIQWNGANKSGQRVASGIYLYRLKVGDVGYKTKKMILLK